jgi:predicted Abi (CAAX) family protease
VQDANQALYITIQKLKHQVNSQPQIQAWIAAHPDDAQTRRFGELQALGTELETTLIPMGIVRQDWQQNAAKLAGTGVEKGFTSSKNPFTGLTSWRTMLPRGAQDGMAKIFSRHRAAIWFLNTYQVGGWHPEIWPIAPTVLFGQMPLLSTIMIRLWAGIVTLPTLTGWLLGLGWLVGYTLVAMAIGFKSGFLTFDRQLHRLARSTGSLFLMPALVEEILFRVVLIPHPIEAATSRDIYVWTAISLGLFIIYHPLNALTLHKPGNPTFLDWRFLCLAGLLGGVCTIIYLMTGSIWGAVVIHWIVVVGWLKLFGGERRLGGNGFF